MPHSSAASLQLILLVFAFVFFLIAAWPPYNTRVNLGWLGLACWVASTFLTTL